jgi:hypothetical protein
MSPARPDAKLVCDEIKRQAGMLTPPLPVTSELDCGSANLAADLASFAHAADTPGGVVAAVSVLTAAKRQTIIQAADTLALPVIYPNRLYTLNEGDTDHGGLITPRSSSRGCARRPGST